MWFVGFIPIAEIYVAIPTGIALGLDDVSTIFWAVFGNFTPALLIDRLYIQLRRIRRVDTWFNRLTSERAEARMNRYGVWFVLLATPWTGIWLMSLTAKLFGMHSARFLPAAFISILVYAIGIVISIRIGADLIG